MSESFIVYHDSWASAKLLSYEQLGKLFTALYAESGAEGVEAPELDLPTNCVFQWMAARLQANKKKYEETVERRREAGKKGGLAKASNAKQKLANASNAKQTVASSTLPDPDPVPDPDPKSNDLGEKKRNKRKSAPGAKYRPDEFERWWAEYPVKEKRIPAIREWEKAIKDGALPDADALLSALAWQKQSSKWQNGYIPNPDRYLKECRWQDERPAPQPQAMPANGYRFQPTGKLQGMDLHNANMEAAKVALAMRAQARAEGRPTSPYAMEANNER